MDYIAIDIWSYENFASMEDVRRKCYPMVDLSKFTSNKMILRRVVVIDYNQVCIVKLCSTMQSSQANK